MKRKITVISLSLILIAAVWFLGVDASVFVDNCPDCLYSSVVYQIRIFTIPIYQRTQDDNSRLKEIAADLGVPCSHPHLERWHAERYWGLIIRAWPSFDGTMNLADEDNWYDDKARAIVRNLAKANPSLAKEFRERVLVGHDWEYLRAFVKKVVALRAREQTSTNATLKAVVK